ncbi:MAG: OmpA/MotB family protein [Bdellovibrionales bacterium]
MGAENLNPFEEVEEDDSHALYEDEGGIAHEDTEGVWLISYADLMTLLMGFFALMLSMANFDEANFAAAGDAVAEYTGGEVEKPFEEIGESIKDVIAEKNLDQKVKVDITKASLVITFEGTLLFGSGSFNLREQAGSLMSELIKVIGEKAPDKKILIEGHTDNIPINRGVIASNWELSSLRANSVARLFETYNFKKEQILTLGFGETRPLSENTDGNGNPIKANQEKNRRVVIKVMNQHPL